MNEEETALWRLTESDEESSTLRKCFFFLLPPSEMRVLSFLLLSVLELKLLLLENRLSWFHLGASEMLHHPKIQRGDSVWTAQRMERRLFVRSECETSWCRGNQRMSVLSVAQHRAAKQLFFFFFFLFRKPLRWQQKHYGPASITEVYLLTELTWTLNLTWVGHTGVWVPLPEAPSSENTLCKVKKIVVTTASALVT